MAKPGPAPNTNDNAPEWNGIPVPPEWLDDEAIKEWNRLAPGLIANGLLSEADRAEFALYCHAYSEWQYLAKLVAQEGYTITNDKGSPYLNPTYSAMQGAESKLHKYAKEFGFTPISRDKLIAKGNQQQQSTQSSKEWFEQS